jgi:phage host-nuclease inhibitor protein Gam
LNAAKKETSNLRSDNAGLKARCEALTSGQNQRSSETASDQKREHDRLRIELTERLLAAEERTANKHAQLLETVLLNQRYVSSDFLSVATD